MCRAVEANTLIFRRIFPLTLRRMAFNIGATPHMWDLLRVRPLLQMSRDFPRAVAYFDFVAAAVLAAWGLFLATAPLHPLPGDSHGGLMAVFPDLLLILLATFSYGSGKLLLRRHIWGWPLQGVVTAGFGLLAVALYPQ